MDKADISLHDFSQTRVLVIGDIMIDQYWFGEVKRISPEAPVPVVDLQSIENRPGGAANVALNLRSMGAQVDIIGITGDDNQGSQLKDLLEATGIPSVGIIASGDRKTTVKCRIMAQGQNLLRVDQEETKDLTDKEWELVHKKFDELCDTRKPDVIILQDYNKGLLTRTSIRYFIDYANQKGIPTMVDPKKNNFFAYAGCTVFKPNKKEVQEALHVSKEVSPAELHRLLASKTEADYYFITLSAEGILVGTKDKADIYPTRKRPIVDVCGAGDTVLSVISLYWTKKIAPGMIARLANIAGGQVCGVAGVAPVDKNALLKEIENQDFINELIEQ